MIADNYRWFDKMSSALERRLLWERAPEGQFHEVYARQIENALRECDAGEYQGCVLIEFHFYWRSPIMLVGSKKAIIINPAYVYPYGDGFEFIVMRSTRVYPGVTLH